MTAPDFRTNPENFCYRHPDRQSFVLCQRCLRTICPECQTQAAVGVICPECMQEQQRSATPAQRTAERRWRRSGVVAAGSGRPVVTYAIIGVAAAVYVLQFLFGNVITRALGFYAGALYPQLTGGPFEPWRLLTASVAHSSLWHVGLNMLALWMIGRSLEPLLGRARFLTLYVLSALGGSVAVALLAPGSFVVGASGAIFGIFGALIIIARHIGSQITGILIVLGINLAIGFIPGMGISWQAHVGGLVTGAVIGLIYARTRAPRQRPLQIGLLIGWAVVLGLLLLVPPAIYG